MGFSKMSLKRFDDYDQIRKARMSKKERDTQDEIIGVEAEIIKSMQESISAAVAQFMAKECIGINELTRRLETSSRQTSRIMKGEANITLATLANIAALMKKKAKIVFD
jgi:DNA-binding Xre family transcriptional regulator